jgi:hypothetical protein
MILKPWLLMMMSDLRQRPVGGARCGARVSFSFLMLSLVVSVLCLMVGGAGGVFVAIAFQFSLGMSVLFFESAFNGSLQGGGGWWCSLC